MILRIEILQHVMVLVGSIHVCFLKIAVAVAVNCQLVNFGKFYQMVNFAFVFWFYY